MYLNINICANKTRFEFLKRVTWPPAYAFLKEKRQKILLKTCKAPVFHFEKCPNCQPDGIFAFQPRSKPRFAWGGENYVNPHASTRKRYKFWCCERVELGFCLSKNTPFCICRTFVIIYWLLYSIIYSIFCYFVSKRGFLLIFTDTARAAQLDTKSHYLI